jgi:hypothetical protein
MHIYWDMFIKQCMKTGPEKLTNLNSCNISKNSVGIKVRGHHFYAIRLNVKSPFVPIHALESRSTAQIF